MTCAGVSTSPATLSVLVINYNFLGTIKDDLDDDLPGQDNSGDINDSD
jgi:hypothetical protein